jgi:hypothetical protein
MWSNAQTTPPLWFILSGEEKTGDRIMALKLSCSKCDSDMQQGVVVDLSYAGILRSMWVEDQAQALSRELPITLTEN